MEFLQRRKCGIGGSDVAAVLGVSPWRTPYQLYKDKTEDYIDVQESDILHFGNVLENVIANEFMRRNGKKVHRCNKLYRHKEHPELIANIDRRIVGGGILECKTCSAWASKKFGESGDEVPDQYMLQCQHYMHVIKVPETTLAVLIGGNDYREFEISYHKDLAEFAANKCVGFWQNHVVPRIPPPATIADNLAEYYIAQSNAKITATPEILDLIEELKKLRTEKKRNELRQEEVTTAIKTFAKENELILDPAGGVVATWKRGKDRANVDYDSLLADLGISEEKINSYTKFSINRPLKVK
jgi:putative phage-type endonuclease